MAHWNQESLGRTLQEQTIVCTKNKHTIDGDTDAIKHKLDIYSVLQRSPLTYATSRVRIMLLLTCCPGPMRNPHYPLLLLPDPNPKTLLSQTLT